MKYKDLTKVFNGKTVINGLNFQVQEGEVFGYLSPNGARKTTTMRIILGLLRPTSGIGALALMFVVAGAGTNKAKNKQEE
ncbi:MAG: hypothetical protein DIAAKJNI_00212 [Candidatus Argoarchaeum ethanivorans]|uniref:ABC transporter domain-containing protein n=1 Tax=Candidatus Argoarchaeum ethanivorans TaxID=2608793 RepID=A0A811T8U0_9EURY|nr:MAG: hypothetical protein DIAAKJNI_00203 [Candidatus Argoarchaeum ethanivorans]CAD6492084.1 MAG: hypothetical protein DIAAKJNI_00212 [Candidatus Argoarchaeum ethanivorans]